jgi:hypothetical protein
MRHIILSMLSITRALVELKTLDSRINKIIDYTTFITYKTKNKNYNHSEEDFKKTVLAEYQSLNDLIERREKIKNAIVLSNATQVVEIANRKMTVAQAIEFKNTIAYKTSLLDNLRRQRQQVTIDSESHRMKVQQKIDDNVRIICGKDSKPDAQVIQTVSDGIAKGDPIDIFDPLGLDEVIKSLEASIEDFNANVDYVLSESNALTKIEVKGT